MLMRCFEKIPNGLGGGVEGFRKFSLFLIAPGLFERAELAIERAKQRLNFIGKSCEILREFSKLGGVDVGFGHN